jgi:NAD(P)-dependent dehydrogenase (short-subunit alcohol dehydrogenase family)
MKPIALITGGTRGIGLGIARNFAEEGFDLAVCGVRPAEEVAEVVQSLKALGADAIYCQCDVADASARKAMLNDVLRHFERVNVLVNNAGVAPKVRNDLLDATEESFEYVLKTNLQGPYFLTQAVARWMVEQKRSDNDYYGCIINVSSVSATVASVNRGEYCISKAGVGMATQLWAARLGEYGIPVYEVRPGIIETDMTAGVKAKYDKLISEGLLVQPRWGLPDDVGKACAMLARGDLAYSTGQVIMVDGGLNLARL